MYQADQYDVIVIGAGHAGIKAALASAWLGCRAMVFTINLDAAGNCPCNPSIGGTAKGHLVREIDALSGEIGRTTDACTIQSRILNLGKGPAVHPLRAQIDRCEYSKIMKHKFELQPNLQLKQDEIVDLFRNEDGSWQAVTRMGAGYTAKCVVPAVGIYLSGKVYVGDIVYESGPDGLFPTSFLSDPLRKLGVSLRRFKTGIPARVLRSSIDLSGLEVQEGGEPAVPFSCDTAEFPKSRAVCHITWTDDATKEIILKNIHRSPLYAGKIEGMGPCYCPSFEDKIMRFTDKKRHQLFIEPYGIDMEELYSQGMSSSLPEEAQLASYRTVAGLEHVEIIHYAYAIEYDYVDPLQLGPTLEFQDLPGLYGTGQFNGSSGYEEAAAQGLLVGVNAARRAQEKEQIILDRAGPYIGMLVDDPVTKGVSDPYRMMASRSEYCLVLRQDNADERMIPLGHELGLISDERFTRFQEKQTLREQERKRAEQTMLSPTEESNQILVSRGTSPVSTGVHLVDLLRRPELSYEVLAPVDSERPQLPAAVLENVEIEIMYEGYIRRQKADVAEMRRLEQRLLPRGLDYTGIIGLRLEAQEKLQRIRPASIGQASRISGVSPAGISVLLIWPARQEGKEETAL